MFMEKDCFTQSLTQSKCPMDTSYHCACLPN